MKRRISRGVKSLLRAHIPGIVSLAAVVGLSSFAFGANRLLPVALVGCILAIWLAVRALLRLFDPAISIGVDRELRAPILLFSLVCVWIIIQALPSLSSGWPLWTEAARLTGGPVYGSISLDAELSLQHLMRLCTFAMMCWLAYILAGNAEHARFAIQTFIGIAAAHAAVGILLSMLDIQPSSLVSFPSNDRRARGLFVNADHFGFLCGMALQAGLAEWLDFRRREARRLQEPRHLASKGVSIPSRIVRTLAMTLLAAGLLASQSRAALGAAMIAAMFILTFQPGRRGSINIRYGYVLAAAALVASVLWFGLRGLGGRFTEAGEALELRLKVIQGTWRALLDYWMFGSGFGTFQYAYPAYRLGSGDAFGYWTQAHNTFLQNLLELGAPAGLTFYVAIFWLYALCLRGFFARRRERLFVHIAIAVGLMGAVHSMVDFPLEIPANTYGAMFLLGVALRQRGIGRD